MANQRSRRQFLAETLAGVTVLTFPGAAKTYAANEKLNWAAIGAGGQASAGIGPAMNHNIMAIAEVDPEGKGKANIAKVKAKFPDCKIYTDYRKLFDETKGLEACWIATPDHHHFPATIRALEAGAGCYTEKPLAYSIWETRKLREVAAAKKLATQMGNQGHSSQAIRKIVEYIWSGIIGDITEVHAVSNRNFSADTRPATKPTPANLDWDAWIGPAPMREYHDGLHPFSWRGYLDFGTGSLGDMACHTLDGTVWGLKLVDAESCEVFSEESPCTAEGFPKSAKITFKFPARGTMPPVTIKWWHGGGTKNMPPRPPQLEEKNKQLTEGAYYYGTKGLMQSTSHCSSMQLIPDEVHRATKSPPETIARVSSHAEDFINACKGKGEASGNFHYSARLTELILLGNLACRTSEKFTYDFKTGKTTSEKANEFLKREPRKGWEFGYQ